VRTGAAQLTRRSQRSRQLATPHAVDEETPVEHALY
jgi:hypothetical protein